MSMVTTEHLIEDYKAMIAADKEHLTEAIERGDRVLAHSHLDAIIDTQRELEDLARKGD